MMAPAKVRVASWNREACFLKSNLPKIKRTVQIVTKNPKAIGR